MRQYQVVVNLNELMNVSHHLRLFRIERKRFHRARNNTKQQKEDRIHAEAK